jgi:long-chain acyl-CoA synthetase
MVPVNTRLATPEIRYVPEDSGARVLFVDGAMQAHAAGRTDADRQAMFTLTTTPAACGLTRSSRRDRQSPKPAPVVTRWPACSHRRHHGQAKGVMLSHNNPGWNAMNAIAG